MRGENRPTIVLLVFAITFRRTTAPANGWTVSEEACMPLASDYPLLGVFWTLFMFSLFLLYLFTVIWCFVDNFRRQDHSGLAKALWFLFIVFVPFIGVFIYLVTRPATVALE
jgi:Phospholipase_D-nuclease N-terminal